MNQYIISICVIVLTINSTLFAKNKFLLNNGIIDIGHFSTSTLVEVPKDEILTDPSTKIVPNKLTYNERLQSEKYECETDFLNTETCIVQQNICPSSTEYADGYSIVNHANKSLYKLCKIGHIKDGNKCYIDENKDGLKDYSYYARTGGYKTEEISGKTYYYLDPECPSNTDEQSDGSCTMKYNWYSYLCPTDINKYGAIWKAKDTGSDCGNLSCTNSITPPKDNCVRATYTCPLNPNQKCGKTLNTISSCESGYTWNNNRCERIESFCGSSVYNATLDICQDITHYSKLCSDSNQTYNPSTDLCETKQVACENGKFDKKVNSCVMDFIPVCEIQGYVYNSISDTCENPTLPICKTQYNFESSTGDCKGEMTMCETGYIYNEEIDRCEKELCNILNTNDSGTRCETQALCDGVITQNGNCIPNTLR